MIHLLKESADVENLRILCRKVRRCEDFAFAPDKLWKLAYDALVGVCFIFDFLTSQILVAMLPHQEGFQALSQRMTKVKFSQVAPQVEKSILNPMNTEKRMYTVLMSMIDVKRLNDSLLDEVLLNRAMVDAYSILFLEYCPVLTACEENAVDFQSVL